MKRLLAVLTLASLLGGCFYPDYPRPPSPPPPAPPTPRHPPADACGAGQLQYLAGRPLSDLPPSPYRQQRVVPQDAAADEAYAPDRLTVLYDPRSGRITWVRCG
jgi:hypothetical protein